MRIWHLYSEINKYDNLWSIKYFKKDDRLFDEIMTFDGRSKIKNWKPLAVKRTYSDDERELSNTPGFHSHIPVVDKKALDILKDLIENFVEVLPLRCNAGEFYALNVIEVLNCIDYEKSKYEMFNHDNRIMCFDKYVFLEDIVRGKHIFKIIDEPKRLPFVSDEFRQRVLDSDLKGFKFELVWDSMD